MSALPHESEAVGDVNDWSEPLIVPASAATETLLGTFTSENAPSEFRFTLSTDEKASETPSASVIFVGAIPVVRMIASRSAQAFAVATVRKVNFATLPVATPGPGWNGLTPLAKKILLPAASWFEKMMVLRSSPPAMLTNSRSASS